MKARLDRLVESNLVAKKYAAQILGEGRQYRNFRRYLAAFSQERPIEPRIFTAISRIPPDDLATILAVEDLKDQIIEEVWWLIEKIVRNFAVRFKHERNCECDIGNLRGQANWYAIWAIYGYTSLDNEFTTYLTHVVRKELQKYILAESGLSGSSDELITKRRQYLQVAGKLQSQSIQPTLHNIAEYLNCDAKEVKKLMGVMAQVASPCSWSDDHIASQEVNMQSKSQEIARREESVIVAYDTCEFIENNLLSNEKEKQVFVGLKNGLSFREIAEKVGDSQQNIRKVFMKIKRKAVRMKEAA